MVRSKLEYASAVWEGPHLKRHTKNWSGTTTRSRICQKMTTGSTLACSCKRKQQYYSVTRNVELPEVAASIR